MQENSLPKKPHIIVKQIFEMYLEGSMKYFKNVKQRSQDYDFQM